MVNGKIQFPQLPVEKAGKGSKLEFAINVIEQDIITLLKVSYFLVHLPFSIF